MSTGSLPPLDVLGLLPGADPEIAPDPYEFLYRLPPPPPAALPTEAGPPAPPSYAAPETLPVPPLGFMDRFATSLAGVPQFSGPMPAEGKGGAFVRGLLGGAAGGISRSGAERMKRAETNRAETNATRKSEADRNYASAVETWRSKLTRYYKTEADREGKVKVTRQMAEDTKMPSGSVGTYMDPLEIAKRVSTVREEDRKNAESTAATVSDPALARFLGVEPGAQTTIPNVISARNAMKPPGGASNVGSTTISPRAQSIINAIKSGNMRPDIIRSLPPRDPVRSEVTQGLADAGVDINTMQYDIAAETTYWRTQNDSKRTSMRTLLNTLEHSVPYTRRLITDLRAAVPDFAISGINRAQLAVVANSRGPDAVLARKLVAQIADIGAEIGGLYMGGNSNTDESFRVAQQNISSNWSEEQLLAALDQIEVNAGIRKRAMDDVVPRTRSSDAGQAATPRTFVPDGPR